MATSEAPFFNEEEAKEALQFLAQYCLEGQGDISEKQRRFIGKLISEIEFTYERQQNSTV